MTAATAAAGGCTSIVICTVSLPLLADEPFEPAHVVVAGWNEQRSAARCDEAAPRAAHATRTQSESDHSSSSSSTHSQLLTQPLQHHKFTHDQTMASEHNNSDASSSGSGSSGHGDSGADLPLSLESSSVASGSKREWTPEELIARAASQREEEDLIAKEEASLRAEQKQWATSIQSRRVGFTATGIAADHPRQLEDDYSQHDRRIKSILFVEGEGASLLAPLAQAWTEHLSARVLRGAVASDSAAAPSTPIAPFSPVLLRALDKAGLVQSAGLRALPLQRMPLHVYDFIVTLDEESRTAVDEALARQASASDKCKRIHQPFARPAAAAAAAADADVDAQWAAFEPTARKLQEFSTELPELLSFMS